MLRIAKLSVFVLLLFGVAVFAQVPSPPVGLSLGVTPVEEPLVVFSPTTTIIQYPSTISAIPRDRFRWEITFTVNSLGNSINGLVGRDENGQTDPGHITIHIIDGRIRVRHQDISGGATTVEFSSTTVITPGVEYRATISMEAGVGLGLFVNGVLENQSDVAFGLSGNSLPLTLGGYCGKCTETVPPSKPIDGVIALSIWAEPMELPVPIFGSVILTIEPPTEFEDCDPAIPPESQPRCGELLAPEYPDALALYELNPRRQIATMPGDTTSWQVDDLPGGEHCFVTTAFAGPNSESFDSNIICRTVE